MERINHPKHYNNGSIECIDAMVSAYGIKEVKTFCKLNAFKYIWRCDHKAHTEEDLNKAKWYISKYLELNSYK